MKIILLERKGIPLVNKISFEKFIGKKVIEINDMYPILIFDGEYKLQETHQKANDILSKLLLGQQITSISIGSDVSDLFIEFSNGSVLELFCNSSIYEGWTLSDGKDFNLVSLPGGKLFIF